LGGGDRVERLYYVLYREKWKSEIKFMLVDGNGRVFTRKALKMLGYVVVFCDTKNVLIDIQSSGREAFERFSTSNDSWEEFYKVDVNKNYEVYSLEKMFDNDKRKMYENLVEKIYGVKL
jgi:hypothetical protein